MKEKRPELGDTSFDSKGAETIEFDGKDILAFIIAIFQIIMPYVLILAASVFVIMVLFALVMK